MTLHISLAISTQEATLHFSRRELASRCIIGNALAARKDLKVFFAASNSVAWWLMLFNVSFKMSKHK
jgi:hypothetical protein